MYGNAYIDPNEKFSSEEETPELLAAFQARIDAGDKIEPPRLDACHVSQATYSNDRATCSF